MNLMVHARLAVVRDPDTLRPDLDTYRDVRDRADVHCELLLHEGADDVIDMVESRLISELRNLLSVQ